MNKNIPEIYNLIQELSWHFGNHGFNGECCGDLSLVEFMALKKIQESNSSTVQEIGNILKFTKSGSSKIVDRLESKGYVAREKSSVDGRVCCVLTTEKGKKTVAEIIENYTSYLDNVLKEIDPQKICQISETLIMLIDAIQRNQPFNTKTNIY